MPDPSPYELTDAYFSEQTARTRATLERILAMDSIGPGRVLPAADDLVIHHGRRFEDASVMFLDISKFSGRPAWTEGEQHSLLQVLSLFFTEMIRIIEDYDGFVEKNTGDGLMAYFVREPSDSASIQQKAVATALTMFYAADHLINPLLQRSGIEQISFRICIDHGPITVARVGAARGFNGVVAIGTTANIASKMLSLADPDSILIGAKVWAGLPESWRNRFTSFKTTETGWISRSDGTGYACWTYTGRWKGPLG